MTYHLVICGPTATGKTAVSVALARRLGASVIIGADSRQLYKGVTAGTFAPTSKELEGEKTALIAALPLGTSVTVAWWKETASLAIQQNDSKNVNSIVVGGTGLYIRSLRNGYAFGGGHEVLDKAAFDTVWNDPTGKKYLLAELDAVDLGERGTLDRSNPRRVRRALEQGLIDADPKSSSYEQFTGVVFGLWLPTHIGNARIRARLEQLFSREALFEEVTAARNSGIADETICHAGIGYREALAVMSGTMSRKAAMEAAVVRTNQYAKAQRTWFRHEQGIEWLDALQSKEDLVGTMMYRLQIRNE